MNENEDKDDLKDGVEIIGENGEGSQGSELETLQNENKELKREKLYLLADFDNYRKQSIKERSDLVKYGAEPILREFLTVLDNLERAASTSLTPETMESYKNGIEMIVSQFKKVLERFGIEEVSSAGETFDPLVHEALSSEENPDLPSNAITQVLKKAYKLRGKVIRPAQVIVNTAGSNNKKED